MRIVWGLIGMGIGFLIVWKTYPLVNFFGKVAWAERHLAAGLGGTYFLFRAIGLLLMFFSAMYMFGLLDVFLSPFTGVFGGLAPQN